MTLETLRQQQRQQIRMAVEDDPEHLVGLALVPVGTRPDLGERRQRSAVTRDVRPYPDMVAITSPFESWYSMSANA